MERGGYENEYGDNARDYDEYELSDYDRSILQRYAKLLQSGYEDEQVLREHIDFVENLLKKIDDVLESEQSIGYNNVTLKHDYKKIRQLLTHLENELDRLDPQDF